VALATVAAVTGRLGIMALERLALKEGELIKDELQALDVDLARFVQVAAWQDGREARQSQGRASAAAASRTRTGPRQDTLVDAPDELHRALINVDVGQVREEVVANED
jgi:hypothetical protein